VDYAELLPALFRLNVGNFYVQLSSEADRPRVLKILGGHAEEGRRIFVGVTDPIDPRIETPAQVRDRILEAAKFIDPARLGSTDDCGFSPFGDDASTSRDTAFANPRASRVTRWRPGPGARRCIPSSETFVRVFPPSRAARAPRRRPPSSSALRRSERRASARCAD
jgi:hypothetical protein